jgi:hypothetical protein
VKLRLTASHVGLIARVLGTAVSAAVPLVPNLVNSELVGSGGQKRLYGAEGHAISSQIPRATELLYEDFPVFTPHKIWKLNSIRASDHASTDSLTQLLERANHGS